MVAMLHAFAHLFVHIFVRWYTFLGTSPGGIAAQIITLLLTEVQGGWWRLQAWKTSWKGGLKRAGLALVSVWLLTFLVCIVMTVYDDHEELVAANRSLVEENDRLRKPVTKLTAELEEEKQNNAILSAKVPSEVSLKNRALQTANEYERFFRKRAKHAPSCTQTSTMSPEEQRAAIEPCTKYTFVTMNEYGQRFAPEIMAMVEEFRAKGINVRDIENCAPQGWCGIAISVQLRAFAARLDVKDNVKR
jgi:hypothetical protein